MGLVQAVRSNEWVARRRGLYTLVLMEWQALREHTRSSWRYALTAVWNWRLGCS